MTIYGNAVCTVEWWRDARPAGRVRCWQIQCREHKTGQQKVQLSSKRNTLPIWVWLINGRHPGEPRPYSIDATLYCTVGGWSEDEDGREQPDRRQDQADGNIPGQVQTVRGGSTGDANTVFLDWWSVFALFAIFEKGYLPTLLPKCR